MHSVTLCTRPSSRFLHVTLRMRHMCKLLCTRIHRRFHLATHVMSLYRNVVLCPVLIYSRQDYAHNTAAITLILWIAVKYKVKHNGICWSVHVLHILSYVWTDDIWPFYWLLTLYICYLIYSSASCLNICDNDDVHSHAYTVQHTKYI